jgi:DNA-binding beta-propeller fold protein YncE
MPDVHTRLSAAFLPLLVAGIAACSPGDPPVIWEYAPYEGDAYPDRRTPLTIPEGGAGFVSNSYSDTLSIFALETGETLLTVPVGRDPVSLDGPHHVAVSPSGDAVYIALSYPVVGLTGPHASHGSSQRSGYAQKLAGADLSVMGQVRVDTNPGDIVLSEDGERLVTSHFDLQRALDNLGDIEAARATIAVVDPTQMLPHGSPAATRISTCVAPHGMVLSRPDGATAYVACYGEDVIAVVDIEGGAVTTRVPVGANAEGFGDPVYGPYSLTLSPSGDRIAIGDTVSNDVRFLDTATLEMVEGAVLSTFGSPYFPAYYPDGAKLLVPTQGPDAVVVFDLATQAEVAVRDFTGDDCILPHVATVMKDGTFALVCEGDHEAPGKVIWLDPDTLETVRSVTVGVYPDAIAVFHKEAP